MSGYGGWKMYAGLIGTAMGAMSEVAEEDDMRDWKCWHGCGDDASYETELALFGVWPARLCTRCRAEFNERVHFPDGDLFTANQEWCKAHTAWKASIHTGTPAEAELARLESLRSEGVLLAAARAFAPRPPRKSVPESPPLAEPVKP